MDSQPGTVSHLGLAGKRLVRRLVAVGENRFELFLLELGEERDRLLRGVILALGVAIFALLAGIGLSMGIVLCFWDHYPFLALMVLTSVYALVAWLLYAKFNKALGIWEAFPATMEQIRKDRQCLEQNLN